VRCDAPFGRTTLLCDVHEAETGSVNAEETGSLDAFRQFFAPERDVLVLSLAMFAFSLGFQTTTRYLPEYMIALGRRGSSSASSGPPATSSRRCFPTRAAPSPTASARGTPSRCSAWYTLGFGVWLAAPALGVVSIVGVTIRPWV